MSNLATGHRQVLESWSDMEMKRKSLVEKINNIFKNEISLKPVVSDLFLSPSFKIRHISKNWAWGPLDEIFFQI